MAADAPLLLQQGDKRGGEDAEIRERIEWFREQRGLDRTVGAAALRAQAARRLGQALQRSVPPLIAREPWQPLGPDSMTMLDWDMGPVSGRVTALAVDPADENLLYLGAAAGGLWKSSDGGLHWKQLFDRIGTESIGSILMEAGNPDHLWVGTGEADAGCLDYFGMGLFFSSDGGKTFEARNGSGDGALTLSFVTALAQSPADPQVLLAGGQGQCGDTGSLTGGGIYRSADGGQSWAQVQAGTSTGIGDILFDPLDATRAYAAVGNRGIYRSGDGGATWTRLEGVGLPTGSAAAYSRLAMAPGDPQVLYVLAGTSNALRLYRTGDGGDTWTQTNADACEGQCWYNLTVDVAPGDPDTVLVGTIRPALSIDGGVTLNILTAGWGGQQAVHQDTHIVRFSRNDGNRLWVGGDGGLWRSDDQGASFENLNANLEITQFYDIELAPDDPERIYGGAQDNSSSRRDGEQMWDTTVVTGDGFMNAVDGTNPRRVFQTSYPSGGASLILSTDSGEPGSYRWVNQTGQNISDPFAWVTPLATAAGSVFVASDRVYRASIVDNADAYSWQSISPLLTLGTQQSIIVIVPVTADGGQVRLYAGARDVIQRSDDALSGNPQWTDLSGDFPGGNVSDIAADPDGQRIFVTRAAFGGSALLRSDGSPSWTGVGAGLPAIPANSVAIDPVDDQRVFVGTDIGVYQSMDGGANFEPFMSGLPLGMVVMDLEISGDPHELVAGTYGRGAWRVHLIDQRDVLFSDGFDPPGR
jgi:photosystem II stability/assembly factor-like uncharacterized protein